MCEADFLVFNPRRSSDRISHTALLTALILPPCSNLHRLPPVWYCTRSSFPPLLTCGPHTEVPPHHPPHPRDQTGLFFFLCSPLGRPVQTFASIRRGNACEFWLRALPYVFWLGSCSAINACAMNKWIACRCQGSASQPAPTLLRRSDTFRTAPF